MSPNSNKAVVRVLTLLTFCTATLLSGCATLEGEPFAVQDPYEGVNRKLYGVIDGVDRRVIAPVARGYRAVMPNWAERGVGNFFRNLRRTDSVANSVLQGKARHAGEDLAGLLVNSTVGIGGLIDVGARMGLKHHEEDFGQTLAVWGVTHTRYIYMPPGPSSLRDAPGTVFKSYLPKLLLSGGYSIWVTIIDLLAIRAEALPLSDARDQAALDPYVFMRDAYYQRREYVTFDGDLPMDDFLEEFDELDEPDESAQ